MNETTTETFSSIQICLSYFDVVNEMQKKKGGDKVQDISGGTLKIEIRSDLQLVIAF